MALQTMKQNTEKFIWVIISYKVYTSQQCDVKKKGKAQS